MQCPKCPSARLDARQSHGIEVDVCSSCTGVWLDRGELDKVITQARTAPSLDEYQPPEDPSTSTEEHVPAWADRRQDDDDRQEWKSDRRSFQRRAEDRENGRAKTSKKKSKPKSLGDRLEELFDDVLDLDLDDIFD